MERYDTIVLGAGPAGMTAGIYSTRYGLRTLIISKEIGGMANLAEKIENYPGYSGSGRRLMRKFHNQAKEHGAEFLDEDIIEMKRGQREFIITTKTKKLTGKSIIIAMGTEKRKLNVPGEDKFLGRGVSYCATCDGIFFKNKDVAVIGAGDSACKAALFLSDIARKVYVIQRGEKEKCEEVYRKNLKGKNNVEFLYNTTPMEIRGKEEVKELIFDREGKLKNLPGEEKIRLDAVFIEIGSLPISDIAKMLKLKIDKNGFIIVNSEMKTNIPGVFAAGDVVKNNLKQVVIAASQGALAAKSAHDYLKGK